MGGVAMYVFTAHLYLTSSEVLNSPSTTSSCFNESEYTTNDKVRVYKYSAKVSIGQNEPTSYASKFKIQGKLLQKSYNSEQNTKFHKYVKFHDIKHMIYNGPDNGNEHDEFHTLKDTVKDFEEPILIVTNQFNKLQGIKVQNKEPVWSINMKKSLASILEVEPKNFLMHENMPSTAFQSVEKTIHGNCKVNINIYMDESEGEKMYFLQKTYEPRSCSEYFQYVDSEDNNVNCNNELQENLITAVERVYKFQYINNAFILRNIIAHEKLSYLTSSRKYSRIHFIETSQSFELENVIDASTFNLPVIDFKDIPIISDFVFDKTEYMPNISTSEEHFSRYKRKLSNVIAEVKEQLAKIINYLKENHIKMKDLQESDQNLLRELQHTMTYLDSESMFSILNDFNLQLERGYLARNIFLEMISHTGTYAAWNFTKHIINNHEISDEIAINMLANLPMHIFNPKEEFVREMADFMLFNNDTVSSQVRQSGILCYSILLHKAYKNIKQNIPKFLQSQLDYLNENIRLAPSYQLRIAYLMAMRNVEVGNIYRYLSPIVRGENTFRDDINPEKYRIAAMWAVAKSISHDKELTFNLFWPILSDSTETLSMRLTAYEFLVPRNPVLDMNLLINLHWMMLKEKNVHVFNYHYTTLKSMVETTNPYIKSTSEVMKKLLRITKKRKILSTTLSYSNIFDYIDTKNDFGRIFKVGTIFNEASGLPQSGYYEEISTFKTASLLSTGIYWNVNGINLKTMVALFKNFVRQQAVYEIPNKNVTNILRKTFGHKLLEKDIKVEFWTMNKGYTTFFFETSLSDFLQKYMENYLPTNFIASEKNLIYDFLDISFNNYYKIIVATDIGIPAFFYNTDAQISYFQLNPNVHLFKKIITAKLKFNYKFYRYNTYEIQFYNPFYDITHSVQRDVTIDVSLPFDSSISLNLETYNIKIILPRVPTTRFSVAGIKVQSVNHVTIKNDYIRALENYCPDCKRFENFSNNSLNNIIYEYIVNSLDTGLEYKYTIIGCENVALPGIETEELFRLFDTVKHHANDDIWQIYKIIIDQGLLNFINVIYTNSCGMILKVSPCTVYATSHIEMNWRFNIQRFGGDLQISFRGSVDTKAPQTNETMRYWDINMNADFSKFFKDVKLQLTRKTKGDKNFVVCLGIQKTYPNYLINTKEMKHETNTKIIFAMEHSNDITCINNNTFINATIKGELLDEQIEQIKANEKVGTCYKNRVNPLDLDITRRFDWNCLYQAITATTMKKYTIDVSYKEVPYEILTKVIILDESLRLDNLARIMYKPNHTEHGNIKIFITYSNDNNYGNISVMNPFFSYVLTRVPYISISEEDRQIDLTLDNTGFSSTFLVDYYNGKIRPCIVHANDVITDLNQTVTMDLRNWTLMTGDHELMTYAVFVKAIDDNKVAVKIYISMHVLEIQPIKSKPLVILDGTVIENYEKGILIPTSTYNESYLKLQMVNELLMIETNGSSDVKIYYSPYNVVILPQIYFISNVDGVCGHMGSTTYVQENLLVCSSC